MLFGTCVENIYLDLGYEDKEDEFETLWHKLGNDERIAIKNDSLYCTKQDVDALENEYGVDFYAVED